MEVFKDTDGIDSHAEEFVFTLPDDQLARFEFEVDQTPTCDEVAVFDDELALIDFEVDQPPTCDEVAVPDDGQALFDFEVDQPLTCEKEKNEETLSNSGIFFKCISFVVECGVNFPVIILY